MLVQVDVDKALSRQWEEHQLQLEQRDAEWQKHRNWYEDENRRLAGLVEELSFRSEDLKRRNAKIGEDENRQLRHLVKELGRHNENLVRRNSELTVAASPVVCLNS